MTKKELKALKDGVEYKLKIEKAVWGIHALHSFKCALDKAGMTASLEDIFEEAKEGAAYDVGEYLRGEFSEEDLCP